MSIESINLEALTSEWDDFNEDLLKKYGENALIYSVLYSESYEYYEKLLISLSLPVIILSGLSSLLSFLSEKLNPYFSYYFIIPGIVSFISASISSIIQFLKISNKQTNARISYLLFNKIYRNVEIQLSLPRNNRTPFNLVIKNIKESFNSAKEQAEDLPDLIIERFKTKYKTQKNIRYPEELSIREIKINNLDNIKLLEIETQIQTPTQTPTQIEK